MITPGNNAVCHHQSILYLVIVGVVMYVAAYYSALLTQPRTRKVGDKYF